MQKLAGYVNKMNVIKKLLITVFVLFSSTFPVKASDISIPLTVHEALRSGISGVDRSGEPVTAGIPFPEGMLYEKSGVPQLGLDGTDSYQFRTLAKWPDGSVKWALVDFQEDVEAGTFTENIEVVRGDGNSGQALALDKGNMITVDTGIMTVVIRKKGFNLFDSVVVNGKKIISGGDSEGIVAVDKNSDKFFASNDRNSTVVIEENGPVRAVIKASGGHIRKGKKLMNYTVRMHFYKDKSRIRVIYTLRNADEKLFKHYNIQSLDLITGLDLTGSLYIKTPTHLSVIEEQLTGKRDELVYYQAVSGFPQAIDGSSFFYKSPIPANNKKGGKRRFNQEGYWIKKNKKILSQGLKDEYADTVFMDVSDREGAGATIGIRFMAGHWPKSLRINGRGIMSVGLWPKENDVGYWIRYGSHNTFEVMYNFHSEAADPAKAMKEFQYPLTARASVDWYNSNVNGVFPLYHFVSFAEEKKYVEDNNWKYNMGNRNPRMKVWRYHYWGHGGFLNQSDFAQIALVNFLRQRSDISKAGNYFLSAEARFNYNADWSVYHSDDYDLSTKEKGKWRIKQPKENNEKVNLAKVVFEWEHPHWYGMPLYYYMTGDERIREAVLEWSEYVKKTHVKMTIGPYPRVWGWGMYTLASMYEFTGDKSFMDLADKNFRWLLKQKLDKERPWRTLFINWNRGYIAGGSGSGWKKYPGIKPGLMTGYIIFDGIYNYYLHLDENSPYKDRAFDVLEGLSDFMYREPYVEGTKKGHWAFWLPYVYNLADKSRSNHEYRLLKMALYVNVVPYLSNGGDKLLERMDKIIRMAAWDRSSIWQGYGFIDHPGLQAILYQRLHPRKDVNAPPQILNLSAAVKGREVVLKWTSPQDAVKYQIKYSKRKLVESLGFNPDTRTYKYNPPEYANWWAGKNVSSEPLPLEPGSKQVFVIRGLKTGSYYFAIRSWDADSNRSSISNLVKVVIK